MAILGIDEVGRGPLAGPLVIGAVVLPEEKPVWVEELRDSKKLTAKKREKYAEIIMREVPGVGLGWVSPVEIDEMGIAEALRLATRRAVEEVQQKKVPFSQIIIDGKVNFLKGTRLEKYVSTAVKADDLIKEVSAASIVAKVARDKYMTEAAEKFPMYGFEKHMGYGTKIHLEAIREYGISEEHRRSFEPMKSMLGYDRGKEKKKNTTRIGERGETAVAEYLTRNGHTVVARNFRTYFYEIDIISVKDGKIYFTEVKTRKSTRAGGGLMAIDERKIKQMTFAAESYMKYMSVYAMLSPQLAVAAVNGEYEVTDWFPIG